MFVRLDRFLFAYAGHRSPADVTERLDRLIEDIKSRFHSKAMGGSQEESCPADVLLVAHGHILRAFAMRWVRKELPDNPSFLLEAGGVGTLRYFLWVPIQGSAYADQYIPSYEHHNIEEPAIL